MCNHNYQLNQLTLVSTCVSCGITKTLETDFEERNAEIINRLLWNDHVAKFSLFTYIPFGLVMESFE